MFIIKKFLFFFAVLILSFSFTITNAEVRVANELKSDITYTLTPSIPVPGEYAILDIKSNRLILEGANIQLFIDDVLVEKGIGKKQFIFLVPDKDADTSKLKIVVDTYNGRQEEKDIILSTATVDLQYEVSNAYKPPFYKGKKLPISNSSIKIYAFPNFKMKNGAILPTDTLIYTWTVDGKRQIAKSGLGKRFLFLNETRAYPWKTKVDLLVTDLSGKRKAFRSLMIEPEKPIVDFYFSENQLMPFDYKSVLKDSIKVNTTSNVELYAVPWFFESLDKNDIKWKIANSEIYLMDDKDKTLLKIVRGVNNALSVFKVKFEIRNPLKRFQRYKKKFIFEPSDYLISLFKQAQEDGGKEMTEAIEKTQKKEEEEKKWTFFGL